MHGWEGGGVVWEVGRYGDWWFKISVAMAGWCDAEKRRKHNSSGEDSSGRDKMHMGGPYSCLSNFFLSRGGHVVGARCGGWMRIVPRLEASIFPYFNCVY
jgi:hypothetical protein